MSKTKTQAKNVLIFGATGMVGKGVLLECLASDLIESVTIINRSTTGITHDKLTEVLHQDFFNLTEVLANVKNMDACFYALGISSMGTNEETYHRYTYELTLKIAKELVDKNPSMTLIYVSAEGADASEQNGSMWARVRGKLENALLKLPFKKVFIFRPGYIQPLKGVKSRVKLYNLAYLLLKPVSPIILWLFAKKVTTSVKIGLAMISLALKGHQETYFDNHAINQVANS